MIKKIWRKIWREVRQEFKVNFGPRTRERLARMRACHMNGKKVFVSRVDQDKDGSFVWVCDGELPPNRMVLFTRCKDLTMGVVQLRFQPKPEENIARLYGQEYLCKPSAYLTV